MAANLNVVQNSLNYPYKNSYRPFPRTLFYYITTSPSSAKGYLKLIQSCKYFFAKNPILVIEDLRTNVYNNDNDMWIAYLDYEFKLIAFKKSPSKAWITNNFVSCADSSLNLIPWIIPRIYRFDVKKLELYNQNLPFDQFLYLSINAKDFTFRNTIIKKEDGSILTLQELVQVCPKIKDIKIFGTAVASYITPETVQKLMNIDHFRTIKTLYLDHIPETFDIKTFIVYVKARMSATIIILNFWNSTLSPAYKNILEQIVDEIMNGQTHDNKIIIEFSGLAQEKSRAMKYH